MCATFARSIAMVLTADPDQMQNQIFNVGDSRLNMTILQLAEKVRDVCAEYRKVEISVTENSKDRRNYRVSFEKIKSILDFSASTLIEPGVEEMALGFLNGRYGTTGTKPTATWQ